MGDFSGLEIALSSLYAQKRALDVTGQNLANVNTDGYSRQRVSMTSNSGPITPALYAKWVGTGMGVQAGDVERLRDQFLELRGYQEHASDSQLTQVNTTLSQIEQAVGEPSDTGIASQLADFWAGWDDVANRPDDLAARSQLVQRGTTLASGFQQLDANLASQRTTTIEQLNASIADVNATAARIADLNQTIQAAVGSGLTPNDLQDQRDALISHLADVVGVTVRPGANGTSDVFVNGSLLVQGNRSEALKVVTDPNPPNNVTIEWTKDGSPATASGTAGGMVQSINDIIPRYRAAIAAVANQVMTVTNAGQTSGYDLYGNPGQAFFVTTPAGIAVNPALTSDAKLVAASASPGTLDGSVAQGLAKTTSPDDSYRSLVVQLGVEAQSASRRVDIQDAITKQVDASRDSESGVSIDEEMTNMVMYQHAYDAAAKFMSTIDSMLDTLINHTGVG